MSSFSLPSLQGPVLMPSSGSPQQLVILLHGYGGDGDNLIDLGLQWQALLPQAVFVAPHAPFPCGEDPYGREWFSLRHWAVDHLREGAQAAEPILYEFIETSRKKWNIPPSSVALVGFSQGAMMALYAALRRPSMYAGVLGFSGGYIPDVFRQDMTSLKVLLIHGDQDTVVPIQHCYDAERALHTLGVQVTKEIYPGLGHSINLQGILKGGQFLKEILKSTRAILVGSEEKKSIGRLGSKNYSDKNTHANT